MISYKPFFDQLKEKDISLYAMEKTYHINKSTLYRMKDGNGISTLIINDICKALNCRVEDILVYVEDEEEETEEQVEL